MMFDSGSLLFRLAKKCLVIYIIIKIFSMFVDICQVTHPLMGLTTEYLGRHGYIVEQYTVKTEDGYLLSLQRIRCQENIQSCSENGPPILMMHGMSSSSSDWLCRDPRNSLPLLLVKRGYDVWLGNNRGNTLSRNHVTLDPDQDAEFWDFSYNEMGIFDLPALINYIIAETDRKNITLIGFSQGFTQTLIFGAERPDYNAKVNLACGLAPVINMYRISNVMIRLLVKSYDFFDWFTQTFHIHKLFEYNSVLIRMLHTVPFSHQFVIPFLLRNIIGGNMDKDDASYCTSNWPGGLSVKQIKHYLQGYNTGNFSKFDYGNEMNLRFYDATSPPHYDLSKVTMPMAIFYSPFDNFINIEDVLQKLSKVTNLVTSYIVPSDDFDHLDFLLGKDATELVYSAVIETIDKHHDEPDAL